MARSSKLPSAKAARLAAAKAEAERIKAERERQARRARLRLTAIIVAALAVVVGVAVIIVILGTRPPSADSVQVKPTGWTDDGGIVIGQGAVAGGESISGPDVVTVDVYSDYLCPYCAQFDQTWGSALASKVDDGEIALVLHDVAFQNANSAGTQYPTRAAVAAAAVAGIAPEVYFKFHQSLFANQPTEGQADTMSTDAQIAGFAVGVGFPAQDADRLASDEYLPWVTFVTNRASDVTGGNTPSVYFRLGDGEPMLWRGWSTTTLDQAIDNVRAGLTPDGETPTN